MSESTARGFMGAGNVLADIYDEDTGKWGGLDYVGNTDMFAISPKSDIKNSLSKGRDNYGQVLETFAINGPSEFSITFNEINKTTLGMKLQGKVEAINQDSGTLAATVTVKLDKWVPIGKLNLSGEDLTVKDATGTTTYDLGVDYEINYRLGLIRALSSGDIAADASVKLAGTYNAVSGTRVLGSRKPQVRARFLFDGKNLADNSPCICEVYEAVIASSDAFDLLDDNPAKATLKGTLKTPSDKTEPYRVDLLDIA
jgi:hypothetical protein